MDVWFEGRKPTPFCWFWDWAALSTHLSLKVSVLQIDLGSSCLDIVKLTLFFFCRHQIWMFENTARAYMLEMLAKVASTFCECSVQKGVGPLSTTWELQLLKMDMVHSNQIVLIQRPCYSSLLVLSLRLRIMKSWKKSFLLAVTSVWFSFSLQMWNSWVAGAEFVLRI